MEATDTDQMLHWAQQAQEVAEQYDIEVREFVRGVALHGLLMADDRTSKGFKFENYYDLLLHYGTPRKAALELPEWCEPMTVKQCYSNAFELATNDPTLTYVEGYALHSVMAVPHAWVEDQDGRIIDPTWAALGEKETHAYYLGVKIDTEFLLRHASEVGWISIFASDWMQNAEVLRLGFVMDGDVAIGMGEM